MDDERAYVLSCACLCGRLEKKKKKKMFHCGGIICSLRILSFRLFFDLDLVCIFHLNFMSCIVDEWGLDPFFYYGTIYIRGCSFSIVPYTFMENLTRVFSFFLNKIFNY